MCSDFQSHWCISNLSHLRNINVDISYVIKAVLENDCFSFHCCAKVSKKIYLQRKYILPKFQTCFSMVNPWLLGLIISVPQWDRTAWSWTKWWPWEKGKSRARVKQCLTKELPQWLCCQVSTADWAQFRIAWEESLSGGIIYTRLCYGWVCWGCHAYWLMKEAPTTVESSTMF